jgi:hypothetical protein
VKKNKPVVPAGETAAPKQSNLQPFINGDESKPKAKAPPVNPNGPANAGEPGGKKNKGKGAASPVPQ